MTQRWYLLNYIAPAMRRHETLARNISAFNASRNVDIHYFLPEIVESRHVNGKLKMISRPLIYHYIFLHGLIDEIKEFCTTYNGLSFVINHSVIDPANRYVTVDDATMHAFRIIARHYSNRLPYYSPADIQLLEGDEVEVVDGPFAGLRGTFIARRGTSDGNIVVHADQNIGSIAYDIKADSIRVLRFSKDSRRAYDQIDAFIPRLRTALDAYRADRRLTPSEAAPLQIFTRRFSATEVPAAKFDAKLQALLWSAHTILGNQTEAAVARARYQQRAASLTNPKTRDLLTQLLP